MSVILGGDFNMMVSDEEKIGSVCNSGSINTFVHFIQHNMLIDLPMEGSRFTWFRGGDSVEASKLDMFLVSTKMMSWFPNITQVALTRGLSDHKVVILKERIVSNKKRTFKWFSHWGTEPEYTKLVTSTIENGQFKGMGELLRSVKGVTKIWVNKFREGESGALKGIEKRMETLENELLTKGMNKAKSDELRSLKITLWAKHRREEREGSQIKGTMVTERRYEY
ncbi:hypothetical protein HRI_002419700 [Hibiscus trionum]|uniref:Endonuclease/exonuclease/phosphatase domain-containing protein n=1 Tax=Hibiscus trionum TaxID=183268 RepID=A0A9W7I1B5_HIBTR|nr:hypothetical protein HRI_002419700 [Hibiscus trionum]